jgi:Holliday junction resolvase RusA-like endonuclease
MIEVVVPGEPVAKGRPRFDRATGRAYTPAKTRSFEGALKYAAQQVMGERPPLEGPLHLDMLVVLPIPQSWSKKRQAEARGALLWPTKKPDFDNFQKGVDALNLVVWVDDGQIVKSTFEKRYGDKPGMWVRVWPINLGVLA